MRTVKVDDRTEASSCTARVVDGGDRVRVNRTLAEKLVVTHRIVYELIEEASAEPEEVTPEEKLLRAIFGEKVGDDSKYDTPEVGAKVSRGDWLIGHSPPRASFYEGPSGEIEKAEHVVDGASHRVTVIVRWSGPLTVGDRLEGLGVVEEIVDDGDSDPVVYANVSSSTLRIVRVLPTATQRIEGRGVGPYDSRTRAPLDGAVLRDDQLEWLARSGGRAIVSDFAVCASGDPILGSQVYEDLIKGGPIADGWSRLRPPASSSSSSSSPSSSSSEGGEL